jgi:hypothetical protein
VVGTLDVLSVKISAVQRHAAVGTSITQGERTAGAIASDEEWDFQQHRLVELVAMNAVGGQGAIPEAGEHE